ncbi:MAG: Holliday junction resolvase RuvX [Gammaproteobacteria bacterium]
MPKVDPLQLNARTDNYLGFDFGEKKIGIATGQLTTGTTSPLLTLRAVKQQPDWIRLTQIVREWRPSGFVVGISRSTDGKDNPVTPKILKFCRQLEGRYRLPVYQIDESLSTFEAKKILFDDFGVNATKLWSVQDQLAAQLILQSWINARTSSPYA